MQTPHLPGLVIRIVTNRLGTNCAPLACRTNDTDSRTRPPEVDRGPRDRLFQGTFESRLNRRPNRQISAGIGQFGPKTQSAAIRKLQEETNQPVEM
jgi:hypothetical protein